MAGLRSRANGWFTLKIQFTLKGTSSTNHFARIDRPENAYNFYADGFHIKKVCSRICLRKVNFLRKNVHFVILIPPVRAKKQRTLFILGSLKSA